MNTSIQIDPVKDGKRLLMVCIAAFIMALNIRTLVHTGGLIPGGGETALLLITDQRYTYEAQSKCIHHQVLGTCRLTLADPRTILQIDGMDAKEFLDKKRRELGLPLTDFEHLTFSDFRNVNAHLSLAEGKIRSGRDLCPEMILRYIPHEEVYDSIRSFYDDPEAVVFGCAGLSGILDRPLDTKSLGLFLFGEVCMAEGYAEFGNLMLSKLKILPSGESITYQVTVTLFEK